MLHLIESFLTNIFYNFPEMEGGGTKIIIKRKPEPKKIIRINLSSLKESNIVSSSTSLETKSDVSSLETDSDIPIQTEEPVKNSVKVNEEPTKLILEGLKINLDRFNRLGQKKLNVLSNLTIEGLERRKTRLFERKEDISDEMILKDIELEIEYIEIMKQKKYYA